MLAIQTVTTSILEVLPLLGFGLLALLGLMLLLLGRKLVRAAGTVSGATLGGIAGLWIGWLIASGTVGNVALLVAGAILGGLLAALTFRLWVALAGAAVLALAAPAAGVIWHGTPTSATTPATAAAEPDEADDDRALAQRPLDDPATPLAPRDAQDISAQWDQAIELVRDWLQREQAQPDQVDPDELDEQTRSELQRLGIEGEQIQQLLEELARMVHHWYGVQMQRIGDWWAERSPGARRFILVAALVGAAVGLGFGLIAPTLAASFESALVGALLLFVAGRELLVRYAPGAGALVPDSPRAVLLLVGLITAIGFLLQWTMARQRSDSR